MPKYSKQDQAEALANLRNWFPAGSTVYTILRHVSASGMSREIGVLANLGAGDFRHPNYAVAVALGLTLGKRDGVKIGGCGMDMGFHIAYELSHKLYPQGFGCCGFERCPSNDHSNGDRDYTPHSEDRPHWHNDGGYALKHRWL